MARLSRKIGMLNKLVDAASEGDVRWTRVLHYLESYTVESSDPIVPLAYESPLPLSAVPGEDLKRELWYDDDGHSILRKVILKGAPADVVAAICQLAPETITVADRRGRWPLHHACRLPPDAEQDKILLLLLAAHPASVLARDEGGRTPLHYLLWYHAKQRSPAMVGHFCMRLPKTKFYALRQVADGNTRHPLPDIPRPSEAGKVTASAAIVPDARHGCLPLHYAVMEGASLEVIQVLLKAYPLSKHVCDRYGRTPLHWYLGAAYLQESVLHVSGEAMDPAADPWWEQPLSVPIIKLLLSSRVARTADALGRSPLHWAAHFWACHYHYGSTNKDAPTHHVLPLPAVKLLLDHHIGQLTCRDVLSMTPLMVLFDSTARLQEQEHSLAAPVQPFRPPMACVELLLEYRDQPGKVAEVEDAQGRLPLHAALEVAAGPGVVAALIAAHPAALLHTTSEDRVPLAAGFGRAFIAPLHTAAVLELVLASYDLSRHGSTVDGRLALKMEDASGAYPIHLACQHGAHLSVIECMVEAYPQTALLQLPNGNLPLHTLLEEDLIAKAMSDNVQEELAAQRDKMAVLLRPLLSDADKLAVADSDFGFLPLHMAVLFQAVPYPIILRMLQLYPEAALEFTTEPSLSPLDLHEMVRQHWLAEDQEWQDTRVLLFSFGPTLESHRHRQELLSRCVKVVVEEVRGVGTYHLHVCDDLEEQPPELELTHTLSAMELPILEPRESPSRIVHSNSSSSRRLRSRTSTMSPRLSPTPEETPRAGLFSQYDDIGTGLDYVVSDTEYDDGTDDSYFTDVGEEGSMDDETRRTGDASTFQEDGMDLDKTHTISSEGMGIKTQPTDESRSTNASLDRIFLEAKRKAEQEEKKESDLPEEDLPAEMGIECTATEELPQPDDDDLLSFAPRPRWASEVGLRLWTFFAFYSDASNPNDNYAKQVAEVFSEIEFQYVQRLVSLPLPPCACAYFPKEAKKKLKRMTFREAANPKCRELILRTCYFLGRFDFNIDETDDILLYRNEDRSSVVVRAYEWVFTTEENTDASNPGVSEATIWESGQVPAIVGLTFRSIKRPVRIHFTKKAHVYENEVQCRSEAGIPVWNSFESTNSTVPLSHHFDASDEERKENRMYRTDIFDERFKQLRVLSGKNNELEEFLPLSEYQYAVVSPDMFTHSLADFYDANGMSEAGLQKICRSIGSALAALHSKGVVHGNIAMSSIVLSKTDGDDLKRNWLLNDFTCGLRSSKPIPPLRVAADGFATFCSSTLPPEMFTRLSPVDLQIYNQYWDFVERSFGVRADKLAVGPKLDAATGDVYGLKCYFSPPEGSETQLPPLPYDLAVSSVAADIWSFGLLVFELVARRPLLPFNARTGHLLSYKEVCGWTEDRAKEYVYEYVKDHLAQDILLRLLAPLEQRVSESMSGILQHPFFDKNSTAPVFLEKRKVEAAAHERRMQSRMTEQSERAVLEDRTGKVNCWDFDLLERICLSPTEVVKGWMPSRPWRRAELPFPCAIAILPYLVHEPDGAPIQHVDSVMANCFGLEFLRLSKACHFACVLQKQFGSEQSEGKPKWSTANMLEYLGLSHEDFGDIQATVVDMASKHVEAFRSDPVSIAKKLVQQQIRSLFAFFDGSEAYLYLVDELNYTPVQSSLYPVKIETEKKQLILENGLMLMYLCSLYARGVSKSVAGLQQLFTASSCDDLPPSWVEAAKGLSHVLDDSVFEEEVDMLQAVLSDMYSTRHRIAVDDLNILRDFLYAVDPKRTFADMERVSAADMCLWTTADGSQDIQQSARTLTFKRFLAQRK